MLQRDAFIAEGVRFGLGSMICIPSMGVVLADSDSNWTKWKVVWE